MSRAMRHALLIPVAVLAAACSTPYQASGWTGGYTDERLDARRWRVAFDGNANRSAGFVRNAAMYRAAELAHREGYPFFQVTGASTVVTGRAYVNFTHLITHRAELTMTGLRTEEEACPPGAGRGCEYYDTGEALADFGDAIGVAPR